MKYRIVRYVYIVFQLSSVYQLNAMEERIARLTLSTSMHAVYTAIIAGDFENTIAGMHALNDAVIAQEGQALLQYVATQPEMTMVHEGETSESIALISERKQQIYQQVAAMLLARKVSPQEALLIAVQHNDPLLCHLLIEARANIQHTKEGKNALGYAFKKFCDPTVATQQPSVGVIALLLEHGTSIAANTDMSVNSSSINSTSDSIDLLKHLFDGSLHEPLESIMATAYIQQWLEEHPEVPAHVSLFNDDYAVVKEATQAYPLIEQIENKHLSIDRSNDAYEIIRSLGIRLQKALMYALHIKDYRYAHMLLNSYEAHTLNTKNILLVYNALQEGNIEKSIALLRELPEQEIALHGENLLTYIAEQPGVRRITMDTGKGIIEHTDINKRVQYHMLCARLLEKRISPQKALLHAVKEDETMTRMLIEARADITVLQEGKNALGHACEGGIFKPLSGVIELLLSLGADIEANQGSYAHTSILTGKPISMNLLQEIFGYHTELPIKQLVAKNYVQQWLYAHPEVPYDKSYYDAYLTVKAKMAAFPLMNEYSVTRERDERYEVCTHAGALRAHHYGHNQKSYDMVRALGIRVQKALMYALQHEDFMSAHSLLHDYDAHTMA